MGIYLLVDKVKQMVTWFYRKFDLNGKKDELYL